MARGSARIQRRERLFQAPVKTLESQSWLDKWKRLPWTGAVLHYDEIALKGGYRGKFAHILERNLRRVLAGIGVNIRHRGDRIVAEGSAEASWEAVIRGARVCGVAYAAATMDVATDMDALEATALSAYRAISEPESTFAVRVRRSDKDFPLTTSEIARRVGQAIVNATGARVNLTHPDLILELRIYREGAVLVGPHLEGPGGLPVGVHPRALVLFSGDIDSPVAAYLIMRRGAPVDFVHFHTFPTPEMVRGSKIVELIRKIVEPQGVSARLYLVPDYPLSLGLTHAGIPARLHLSILRRFMMRVADALSDREGYTAVVTGDSLGQVASQTMENLAKVDEIARHPVLRPLIGLNKREIVALSRSLELYDLSILPYKDCCGLVAKRSALKPNPEELAKAEERLDIQSILAEALRETVYWTIGSA